MMMLGTLIGGGFATTTSDNSKTSPTAWRIVSSPHNIHPWNPAVWLPPQCSRSHRAGFT